EIAGIAGVFRNLPQAGQANAVRMHQAAEAFPIRAPTQVGGRINGTLGGLPKHVRRTVRQDAVQQAAERDRVDWQRRLSPRPPCSLIGIGEQRFAHVGEARTTVGAVFIGDAFYPKRTRTHGGALTSRSSGRAAFAFATRAIAARGAAPPGFVLPQKALSKNDHAMPALRPVAHELTHVNERSRCRVTFGVGVDCSKVSWFGRGQSQADECHGDSPQIRAMDTTPSQSKRYAPPGSSRTKSPSTLSNTSMIYRRRCGL